MKILIVDNDRDLVEMLISLFNLHGYEVSRAYTANGARSEWLEQHPDIVLIDTAFKDGDMLTLCREMRMKHDALVIIVTEEKDVQHEVSCLESGADDYLRKPFFPSQILARVRTVGKRSRSTLERRPSSIVTVGPLCIDTLHNEVIVNGKTIRLTPTESRLLHLLAISANDVCTTNQILTHVWGYDGEGDSSLIKAHIHHLRQKVEPDPGDPQFILTVPGVGYSLIKSKRTVTHQQEKAS